ncbi:MAG: hypothetical protein WC071_04915 [Victivallaceae bacterium]
MNNRWKKFSRTAIFICLLACSLAAAALECTVCHKKIKGNFLKSNGRIYCSQDCFNKTLPTCAACGKVCSREYFQKDNKFYCSKACLSTTLPHCSCCGKAFSKGVIFKGVEGEKVFCPECANKPKCFSCTMPGDCKTLNDGRYICNNCAETAILEQVDADKIFSEVRECMKRDLNIVTDHQINFLLIDVETMKKRSPDYAPGQELGLYTYECTVKTVTSVKYSLIRGKQENTESYKTNVQYSIYLLYGIPKKKFIEVCAHELAHDWMQERYPAIKDLKIKEGWAEYIAALVNTLYGQSKMNERMEKSNDGIYGAGYHAIKDYIRLHGEDGLWTYLEKLNRQ